MSKIITADEAANLIEDGMTVAFGTMGLAGWAEEVAQAVEKRFLKTGRPRNLNVVQGCNAGDRAERGITRWGHEGLIKRWTGAHIGFSPGICRLIEENKLEAYCIPQGVIINLWRDIAAGRPGMLSRIGLGTFIDPRVEGGKMNDVTTEDVYRIVELDGEEYIFYKSFPVDVALIRGTAVDENGNLTLDNDGMFMEQLQVAEAAKNTGGIVIAQAEYLAKAGSLHPKKVKVPGILVDYIVIATDKRACFQTEVQYFEPSFSGDLKVPLGSLPVLPLDADKIIVRRAAVELVPDAVVNLGVGIAASVASVAAEEGVSDAITLTTEAGVIGGVPAGGQDFGQAYNPEAIIEHNAMFDYYDGGGLDLAFLGLAQADAEGNVNVSKFGRPMGPGGFINITQNAKKLVFTGTFTSGGLEAEVKDGKIRILREGRHRKFKTAVEQITFSGKYARAAGRYVLYVTERCVFALRPEGLALVEIAPGIDLEKDILAQMDFKPVIGGDLRQMPAGIFEENWGGLGEIMRGQGRR
jgi:propionate CoA-transferase